MKNSKKPNSQFTTGKLPANLTSMLPDPKAADRELDELERSIMLLKRDYEVFFTGSSKRPPMDAHNRVKKNIKIFQSLQGLPYAQRFRYSSLVARFNTFSDLWNKQLRLKEEGRFGAHQAGTKLKSAAPTNSKENSKQFEKIYQDYLKSREMTGERRSKVDFDNFSSLLAKQRNALLQKFSCKDVTFYVTVENGRTKLKARPVK
jgi:hypothetical protein